MNNDAKNTTVPTKNWRKAVAKYQKPSLSRSLWQLANTLVPYLILWFLMVRSLAISYWLTLALAIPAAGLLVRVFIFFHDCGHNSFFASKTANAIIGFITGVLVFTPYQYWRHNHAIHHATAGDLDRRDVGDVWTLTVGEFLTLPAGKQLAYRLFRHPLVMFGLGPHFMFLIAQRVPRGAVGKRERNSVHWTNLALLGVAVGMSILIGFKSYLMIQLPVIMLAATAGVWLFYVQHQYENVTWERHEKWSYASAALTGSSFYKLPKILQWFSGNIGFHHIHHLAPRIPNYYLEKCYQENALFQKIEPLTLLSSLKSLTLRLWDEEKRKLVSFGAIRNPTG